MVDWNRAAFLLAAAGLWLCPGARAGDDLDPGKLIYLKRCASCHGQSGEGVEAKHAEPLAGDKSVLELARYIARAMPKDEPKTCVGQDAEDVARYIHGAFYSPIAQARNRKARIELVHLTVRQYKNAAADLLGGFRDPFRPSEERGLRGEYFNSVQPGRQSVLNRIDPQVRFDFGRSNPAPDKLGLLGFAARWEGSVEAPDTGDYEFTVRTDHAARLWVNDPERPLIDAWVKSGSDNAYRASLFLMGGRAYPLRLEFSSRKQGVQDQKKKVEEKPVLAFIELFWKPPRQVAEAIPSRHLFPEPAPVVFVVGTPFPPDDRSAGYERGTSVSKAWDEAATAAAIETAGYVAGRLDELAGLRKAGAGSKSEAVKPEDRESKVREFCGRFLKGAFRRPLTGEESRLYVDRQFERAPDLETAVKRVVLLALKSPRFLYLDLGPETGPGGALAPNAFAVAARLSFALWDSLPDREILDAAAAGQLSTREQVARQAARMVHDPRTRSKLRQFLHGWLGVERVPDLSKDKGSFPGFGESLASDLRTSLDLFLDDVIWGERSDFRQLLISNDLYLNGRVARFYGFDLAEDAPFQKVSSERTPRAGVLGHPYLMARFAYADASSPIHRGVFLTRSILGRALRPPPEAFAPLSPALHPDLTTRQRVSLQTQPETCQSCHGIINPLGFALERFDAAGRYREEERGKPIDASGSYRLPSGEVKTFNGVQELSEFLVHSEEVERAFVSQLFHHLVKQPILAYGRETPAELERSFVSSGFNVRGLMAEIAARVAWAGQGQVVDAASPAPPAVPVKEASRASGLDSPPSKEYHEPASREARRRRF